MLCNKCKIREKVDYNGCKVCGYKNRNCEKIVSILQNGQWTESELDIILENILYHKIEVVNELEKKMITMVVKCVVIKIEIMKKLYLYYKIINVLKMS